MFWYFSLVAYSVIKLWIFISIGCLPLATWIAHPFPSALKKIQSTYCLGVIFCIWTKLDVKPYTNSVRFTVFNSVVQMNTHASDANDNIDVKSMSKWNLHLALFHLGIMQWLKNMSQTKFHNRMQVKSLKFSALHVWDGQKNVVTVMLNNKRAS